jgi:hypothetical protein
MAPTLIEGETVPGSAFAPCSMSLGREELARQHDRSLNAELRCALGLYIPAANGQA